MSDDRRRYSKVSRRMWNDENVRSLSWPPPNGLTLWQRLLTGPELTNIPGLFSAWEAGLAQAQRWDLEGFREAFAELSSKGMVKADWKAGLVWVPKAIFHNKPESPNVVRSWAATYEELPECALKREALDALRVFVTDMGKSFAEAFREAFGEGSGHPSPNQEQEQEQEQDPPIVPQGGPPAPLALKLEEPAKPKILGKPVAVVMKHRDACLRLLAELSAARIRARKGNHPIDPTYAALSGIAARLDEGRSEEQCRHVIAVCEAEVKTWDGTGKDPMKFFDAVSPWRPDNFERKVAMPLSTVTPTRSPEAQQAAEERRQRRDAANELAQARKRAADDDMTEES